MESLRLLVFNLGRSNIIKAKTAKLFWPFCNKYAFHETLGKHYQPVVNQDTNFFIMKTLNNGLVVRPWTTNRGSPGLKITGVSKVDLVFNLFEVDQMTTRNSWGTAVLRSVNLSLKRGHKDFIYLGTVFEQFSIQEFHSSNIVMSNWYTLTNCRAKVLAMVRAVY